MAKWLDEIPEATRKGIIALAEEMYGGKKIGGGRMRSTTVYLEPEQLVALTVLSKTSKIPTAEWLRMGANMALLLAAREGRFSPPGQEDIDDILRAFERYNKRALAGQQLLEGAVKILTPEGS